MCFEPRVVFSDNHCLAVVKPWNMLVQGDSTGDPSLLDWGKDWIKRQCNKPGRVYLGLVHRLDRPASGIVLFARTSKAASRLSEQFRAKTVTKRYWAVVEGDPGQPREVRHELVKDESKGKVHVSKGGKLAVLRILSVHSAGRMALVQIDLETGRPHQIRAQLAAIGSPIAGDLKYGASEPMPARNISLFAGQLAFDHPTSKERIRLLEMPPLAEYPWILFDSLMQEDFMAGEFSPSK